MKWMKKWFRFWVAVVKVLVFTRQRRCYNCRYWRAVGLPAAPFGDPGTCRKRPPSEYVSSKGNNFPRVDGNMS
ncbi:MAG: hypothetical protein WCK89_25630, partial [bacterium]